MIVVFAEFELKNLVRVDHTSELIIPGSLVINTRWNKHPPLLVTDVQYDAANSSKLISVSVLSDRDYDPISTFVLPKIRQYTMSAVANQIFKIQPMTIPVGSIFYLDYTYGSGSIK